MGKGEISMSIEKNVQIVKNFLAALGRRDKQGLLALSAEDIEWIIPGEDWPLAGTHRGHAGLENLLQKANETLKPSSREPHPLTHRHQVQIEPAPELLSSRATGSYNARSVEASVHKLPRSPFIPA